MKLNKFKIPKTQKQVTGPKLSISADPKKLVPMTQTNRFITEVP